MAPAHRSFKQATVHTFVWIAMFSNMHLFNPGRLNPDRRQICGTGAEGRMRRPTLQVLEIVSSMKIFYSKGCRDAPCASLPVLTLNVYIPLSTFAKNANPTKTGYPTSH